MCIESGIAGAREESARIGIDIGIMLSCFIIAVESRLGARLAELFLVVVFLVTTAFDFLGVGFDLCATLSFIPGIPGIGVCAREAVDDTATAKTIEMVLKKLRNIESLMDV